MQDVFIVSAVRTAIGSFGGMFKDRSSSELAAEAMREAVRRSQLPFDAFDEVIVGNVFQAGGKGNPARQAQLMAGFPVDIPAMTVNKQCASGMRAISLAYRLIQAGEADVVLAGGTESMSRVPHLLLNARWGKKLGDFQAVDGMLHDGLHCAIEGYHMGVTAENVARKYGISREDQDRFALNSQRKAAAAIRERRFEREIVPVGDCDRDEHPRDTSFEKLQQLKPVFEKNGTVTAGNASGINDGAAALVLVSERIVKERKLTPLARICAAASAGVDPSVMGIGPVPATRKALASAGMTLADIDLIELNEAFAAQALAVIRELELDEHKVNVNGGAIALGHPVGCSGARIVVTLVHEMMRSNKRKGLATLCVGGGQGTAMIIETV